MPSLVLSAAQPCRIAGTGAAFPEALPDGSPAELDNPDVIRLLSPVGPLGVRDQEEVLEVARRLAGTLGVQRRRWAHRVGDPFSPAEESTVDLQVRALSAALDAAGVPATDLGAVIAATSTPPSVTRGNAPQVASRLGPLRCAAFDLRAGCAGGVHALVHGALWAAQGGRPVAVVAADTFSKVIPPSSALAALAMGDGAGAAVLLPGAQGAGSGLLGACLDADGGLAHLGSSPSPFPPTREAIDGGLYLLAGSPEELVRTAVPRYRDASLAALAAAGLAVEDVDLFLPHQAGLTLARAVCAAVGVPAERTFCPVERHANTGSASVLVALHEARAEGRAGPGRTLLLAALGGGLCWGAVAWRV